jgi:hypothetical protein
MDYRSEAGKHHTQYQRMIRQLIDAYVDTHGQAVKKRSTRTARKRVAG